MTGLSATQRNVYHLAGRPQLCARHDLDAFNKESVALVLTHRQGNLGDRGGLKQIVYLFLVDFNTGNADDIVRLNGGNAVEDVL